VEENTMNAQDIYMEFSTLKLLKFAYTLHTVALSTHHLKPHGVGYITITKLLLFTLILLTPN
jgi:hypothetical protein